MGLKYQRGSGKKGQVHCQGVVRNFGQDGSPKCRLRKTSANVRISNTKEDKAGQDGSPKCRLMKTSANVRISNTKEDKAGQDGSLKCRLMKMLANVQIPNTKEVKAKVDKYIFGDLGFRPGKDRMHLPNAASGKRPRISGKCPDLKYQRG